MNSVFEPDGFDVRLRVGLLVPDIDIGPESEWSAIKPPGVATNASRFRFPIEETVDTPGDEISMGSVEAVAAPGALDDAINMYDDSWFDVFSLAFTSTSYVGDDAELAKRLSDHVSGKPVVTTGQALLGAVEHFQASRVMLVDPPWFPEQLTALGRAWLERNGVSVVKAQAAGLPSGQGNVHPAALHRWLCQNAEGSDLILIGGNGFRATGVIRAVEEDIDVPVVGANSGLLWATLRAAGRPTNQVTRYGRIFSS